MNYYNLADHDATNIKLTGGKASSLARMMQSGINIPNGFVIPWSTHADKLKIIIQTGIKNLNCQTFAVRSSAVAEDGKAYSWAGQYDSYLNVTRDELVSKTILCLESQNSARVNTYSQGKTGKSQLAVIIQEMVTAEYSGVAFSISPVQPSGSEMLIEVVPGSAEKLVQGEIVPEQIMVNRKSGKVTGESELDGSTLQELITNVYKLEKLFGYNCDVEWAVAGNKLFILQCRPITTLINN